MNRELFNVWRAWTAKVVPVENFTRRRRTALSYDLESRLDHSRSWIVGIARRVIDGQLTENLSDRIGEEQAELEAFLADLQESQVAPGQKQRLRSYVFLTQALLGHLAEAVKSGPNNEVARGELINCPRCEQDWLEEVHLVYLKKNAIVCPECEAFWVDRIPAAKTAESYSDYMARHGRLEPWHPAEVEVLGFARTLGK